MCNPVSGIFEASENEMFSVVKMTESGVQIRNLLWQEKIKPIFFYQPYVKKKN